MKANELRIGCSFQLENSVLGGGIATIKNKYDLDVAFDLLESNLIKPIPLTKEWLLKLGFKEVSDRIYVKNYHYGYEFGITNYFVIKNGNHFIRYKHIKYFHQLQNVYFALNQEELQYESK